MSATYGLLEVPGAKLCYKVRGEGPLLLLVQGGLGDADSADALAVELAGDFTLVTYDRRGLSRSPIEDPRLGVSIERHAEDACALLTELSLEPALVFGSSLGALIGLDLLTRFPQRVQTLIAHEPLSGQLMSTEEQARFAELRAEVAELALREGAPVATRHYMRALGARREDCEDDVEPPPSTRGRGRSSDQLLTRESRALHTFQLDLAALLRLSSKVVPAFGSSSRDCLPARCALALGAALGQPALEFPGGHTGYALRPRAFSQVLRQLVRERGDSGGGATSQVTRMLDPGGRAAGSGSE